MKVRIHDRGKIRQNTRAKECSICVCVAAAAVVVDDVKSEVIMKNRHDEHFGCLSQRTSVVLFTPCPPHAYRLTHRPRNATEVHIECFGILVLLRFCRVSHSSINHFHSLYLGPNGEQQTHSSRRPNTIRDIVAATNTIGI